MVSCPATFVVIKHLWRKIGHTVWRDRRAALTWRSAQRQGLIFITVNDGSASAVKCRRDIRELQDLSVLALQEVCRCPVSLEIARLQCAPQLILSWSCPLKCVQLSSCMFLDDLYFSKHAFLAHQFKKTTQKSVSCCRNVDVLCRVYGLWLSSFCFVCLEKKSQACW